MRNPLRIRICVVLCLLAILAASCRSTRTVSLSGVVFNTLSARLRLTLPVEGKKTTLRGSLRIVDGSLIQVSVQVPVVRSEAARIEITPDSVLIIDRMNKLYARGPLSGLEPLFGQGVDYPLLQSVFTNDAAALRHNIKLREIKIELSDLDLDKAAPRPTTVTSRYRRVELDDLIHSLDEMQ